MAPKIDLVNVKVSVNGKEQTIKMEKGTSFENKSGIFTAGESKQVLKMTNYQLNVFKAMANNYVEEGETGIVLSKKDIQEAQQKYKNGEFIADMSEFLPEGYRLENPKLTSAKNMVQAYVTNGKESQSATLKFSFDIFNKESTVKKATNANDAPKLALKDYDEEGVEYTYGYEASKGSITSYYNREKELVGSIEELSNGKTKYMDKNGECLYYIKNRTVRMSTNSNNGEEHIHIYDKNNKLKYILKFDYNKYNGGMSGIPVEVYDKDGNLAKRTTGSITPYFTELDDFKVEKFMDFTESYGAYCIEL